MTNFFQNLKKVIIMSQVHKIKFLDIDDEEVEKGKIESICLGKYKELEKEIHLSKELKSFHILKLMEVFIHEVMHGYSTEHRVEELLGIDTEKKEEIFDIFLDISAISMLRFMIENTKLCEDMIREIKKSNK